MEACGDEKSGAAAALPTSHTAHKPCFSFFAIAFDHRLYCSRRTHFGSVSPQDPPRRTDRLVQTKTSVTVDLDPTLCHTSGDILHPVFSLGGYDENFLGHHS